MIGDWRYKREIYGASMKILSGRHGTMQMVMAVGMMMINNMDDTTHYFHSMDRETESVIDLCIILLLS